MSKIINVAAGISTIGNPTSSDELISSLGVSEITSLKTLVLGAWASWSVGAPDEFQGFLSLNKGIGYVCNSTDVTNFNLPGGDLDVNDIDYQTGLSMLSLPFDGRKIGDGFIPRIEVDSLKMYDGSWKSWSKGADEAFQGFINLNIEKGYVCNVATVFGSYLDTAVQNLSEGVRFNTNDTTISDGQVENGVKLTDPYAVGQLSFDKVSFDETIPALIMFASINGNITKIEFPTEYTGRSFYVSNGGSLYTATFTENEDYSAPTAVTETVDSTGLELSYDSKVVDVANATFKEMTINLGSVEGIIEYATDYEGDTLTLWKDGETFTTVFSEGVTVVPVS